VTLTWHDHFATSNEKVGNVRLMLRQYATLRAGSLGRFHDLAHAMLRDGAMQMWLDLAGSSKEDPNENFARELFELPIIGVISPGAQAAVEATRNNRIGVISTEGTMRSQEYLHAIKEIDPMVGVYQKACPELVEIVEAGEADSPRAEQVLRDNLSEGRQALVAELQASVFQTLDEETWERLEEALIYAYVGASTTAKIFIFSGST